MKNNTLPVSFSWGFPESEQPYEYVLLGVLVRQEGLPSLVCKVITPDQLDLKS
jgi:hypothetical protein